MGSRKNNLPNSSLNIFKNIFLLATTLLISTTASAKLNLDDYSSIKDHSAEIAQYQNDCEKNKAEACERLGWHYIQGFAIEKDFSKAKNALNKAVKLKNNQALIDLGLMNELDENINFSEAKKYYEQALKQGNQDANLFLAKLYIFGYGVAKDNAKALSLLKQGCKKGSSLSCLLEKQLSYEEEYLLKDDEIAQIVGKVKESKNPIAYSIGVNLLMNFASKNEQNFEQIYNLAKEGCLLESGYSCVIVGILHNDPIDSLKNLLDPKLAEAYYRKSCTLNDFKGCGTLSNFLSNNNNNESIKFLIKACTLNNSIACNYTAINEFESKNYDEAFYYSQRGCQLNSEQACNLLGIMYGNGLGTPINYDEAFSLFKKGCELDNAKACLNAGNMNFKILFPNYSQKKDEKKGEEYLKKSCDMDEIEACEFLAEYYYATDLDGKKSKIKSLLKKTCDLGSYTGCSRLLEKEKTINVTEKDEAKIVNNLDILCESKKYDACWTIGLYYQYNQNNDKALSYFKKGCDANNLTSCEKLANNKLSDKNAPEKDIKEALDLLSKNCDEKTSTSCLSLANYYRGSDNDLAKQYIVKSCELANQEACFEIYNSFLSKMNFFTNGKNIINEIPSNEVVKSIKKLCEIGDYNGCAGESLLTYYGLGVEKNTTEGLDGLRKNCDKNASIACANLGYIYLYEYGKEHQKEILPLFEKSCNLGYVAGCNLALVYVDNTDNSPKKEEKLITYLQVACKLGNEANCSNLFDRYANGAKYLKKETGAFFYDTCINYSNLIHCAYIINQNDYFGLDQNSVNNVLNSLEENCKQENYQACTIKAEYNLNKLYKAKNDENVKQSINLLDISCKNGYGPACKNLIIAYSSDKYIDNDDAKLQSYIEKSCELGDEIDCLSIINQYMAKSFNTNNPIDQLFSEAPSKEVLQALENIIKYGYDSGIPIKGIFQYVGNGMPQDRTKGLEQLKVSCDNNSPNGCYFLGYFYITDEALKDHKDEGITIIAKSCDLNNANACNLLGYMYKEGNNVEQNNKKAIEFFQKGCSLNKFDDCDQIDAMYNNGVNDIKGDSGKVLTSSCINDGYLNACEYVVMDLEFYEIDQKSKKEVLSYIDKMCNDQYYVACKIKGRYSINKLAKNKNDKNVQNGLKLLDKSCQYKVANACMELGFDYRYNELVNPNYEKSLSYLKQGCSLGEPNSCNEIVTNFFEKSLAKNQNNNFSEKAPQDIVDASLKYCEEGYFRGCTYAGVLYYFGNGVNQDQINGLALIENGCNNNIDIGCLYSGMIKEQDKNSSSEVISLYEKACDLNNAYGCFKAGNIYKSNGDKAKSQTLYQKACDLHLEDSCKEIGSN